LSTLKHCTNYCFATEKSEAIVQWKEMPFIPVNKVADKKIIIGKGDQGGGAAQGASDPPKHSTN
jgi:hypothetical protein